MAKLEEILENSLITAQIFEHLNLSELISIRFVSKQFYSIILSYLVQSVRHASNDMKRIQLKSEPYNNSLDFTKRHELLQFEWNKLCRSICSLRLSYCHWVDDRFLLELIDQTDHSSICSHSSFELNTAVPLSLSLLQSLYLDSCWNLTNGTLAQLFGHCTAIKRLSLANIYSIEDRLLELIGDQLNQLEWINLRNCWRVTDQGVRQMVERNQCKSASLIYLDLTKCSQVTADCVALLMATNLRLTIVHDKKPLLK